MLRRLSARSLTGAAPVRSLTGAVPSLLPLLLPLLLVVAAGCAPEAPPAAVAPVSPPPAPPPTAAPAPPAPPAPPPVDAEHIDPSRILLVIEDPRLAAVKADADQEAYARAAAGMANALATASPSPEERREWLYQLGHLRALGGDPAGAAKAFEESAASAWALSDYARLEAAQWQVGVGQFDAALRDLQGIAPDLPIAGAVDLATADALLGKNDFAGAAKHFRSFLAREKHPPGWTTVALRFASALLQHPKEAHAEEAVHLARRVMWESTGGQGAGTAKDLEKQALETIPHKKRKALEHLSIEEQIAKAHGLVASGQPREGVLVTDKLVKLHKLKKPGVEACEAWLARAEGLAKMRSGSRNWKPEAADAYKGAIEHCEGQPRRADALFAGGRASASAGRHLEAIERFALLEKEMPTHRLADDARLRGAKAALDAADEPRFVHMLETIADAYPEGDVTNDGLFDLALFYADKQDWAHAIPPLEKALARTPKERAYWASGRLPYFLARAHLETGNTAQGLAELASVIRSFPLTYYMALAYARLEARDHGAAERALAEAMAREPTGPFTLARGPWLTDPVFVRALELLRQGEARLARGELDRIGFTTRTAPREVLWTTAFLLARQGAYTQSHSILRTPVSTSRPRDNELTDWLEHYPQGRWRAAWELSYPRPYAPIVAAEAKRQNLPEAWAYAIMREESAFEPRVVSGAKAVGLMQLIVDTARKIGERLSLSPDEESLKQPPVNIAIGCRYLAVLRGQFPDNPLLAIPGYNAGAGAPKKWLGQHPTDDFDLWVERIPYEETRNYTKRVMSSMAAYELLYFHDQQSEALRSPIAVSPSARGAAPSPVALPSTPPAAP